VKILFLTPRFPYPPDRGDRLTVFNLLRALSRRHAVHLISFRDGHEPREGFDEVSRVCARSEAVRLSRARSWLQAWLGLPLATPSQVSYYRSGAMSECVRRAFAAGDFDAVISHTIRTARYAADLSHRLKVLWLGDSLGLILRRSLPFSPAWKRPGIAWEARRVDRFEARVSRSFRETWVLSRSDRDDLLRVGCENVAVVPHGVDERLFEIERRPTPDPRVVFLGNLSVPHNVDAAAFAALAIWPQVRRSLPDARLLLVGASPAGAVRRLATNPGVEVGGFVPDLRATWASAHALLAPVRFSTGIQNKVLEAMAAGVPVVTTPQVAEGIGARPGEHVLVAEEAGALAEAVVATVRDPAASAARARRAREHVRLVFRWDAAVERLEALAGGAVSGALPAGGATRR
jgi:sugar transferase (PEP-CTERM/EpsH1 system associated)